MNREEALEIIRNIYQTDEEKEALKALIPELNECEDERIVKEIIRIVDIWTNSSPVVNGIPRETLLAYLEKQKEPHYTKRNALFDKCVEDCDPEVMKSVSDEVDEMLEKEQKPAEWSEEDEKMRFRIIGHLTPFIYTNSLYGDDAKECIDWLKSLRPQPKSEWSEEDEKKLSAVLFSISRYGGEEHLKTKGYKYAEILSWLKSLRPQPKAEWSEEDEAKKERLISIVKRALHGNKYPILNDNGATELITWLKSLRPQPHKDTKCEPKKGDIVVNKDKKL